MEYDADDYLTDKEYAAISHLYNEFNTAFIFLPEYMKAAYFKRLYAKEKQIYPKFK